MHSHIQAGAFALPGEPDALTKIKHLEDAGVTMVNHPAKFGEMMKKLLRSTGRANSGATTSGGQQRRGMHFQARPFRRPKLVRLNPASSIQKRTLYIRENIALELLRERGMNASEGSKKGRKRLLAVAVDRTTRTPCLITSPDENSKANARSFPFDYLTGLEYSQIPPIADHLQLEGSSKDALPKLVNALIRLFVQKEAFLIETLFVEEESDLTIVNAHFGFDDAAFKSAKRQGDVHALRKLEDEDPQEAEAEKDGIVYIKLSGDGNIGTLV